jgi:hypothetical protein
MMHDSVTHAEQDELEEFPHRPCVGSGLCCKTAPCPFGTWDQERRQCAYLEAACEVDGTTIYRCGHYETISRQPGANISPAFGAGCCMPLFNSNRARIVRVIAKGDHPEAACLLEKRL